MHAPCAWRLDSVANPCTQLRYANNSNYKNDEIITREVFVSKTVIDEFKRIIVESDVGLLGCHTRHACMHVQGSAARTTSASGRVHGGTAGWSGHASMHRLCIPQSPMHANHTRSRSPVVA